MTLRIFTQKLTEEGKESIKLPGECAALMYEACVAISESKGLKFLFDTFYAKNPAHGMSPWQYVHMCILTTYVHCNDSSVTGCFLGHFLPDLEYIAEHYDMIDCHRTTLENAATSVWTKEVKAHVFQGGRWLQITGEWGFYSSWLQWPDRNARLVSHSLITPSC